MARSARRLAGGRRLGHPRRGHPGLAAGPLRREHRRRSGALNVAAERPRDVRAVVCRGGRVDLADRSLRKIPAPTLLIVGERDEPVLGWNRQVLARLGGESELRVIPGATHLFPEPGALDAAAHLAAEWFTRHLPRPAVRGAGDRSGPACAQNPPFATPRLEILSLKSSRFPALPKSDVIFFGRRCGSPAVFLPV